jgi:hypothetical protein
MLFSGEKFKDLTYWMHTQKDIKKMFYKGIYNYAFRPQDAGLICFDIDTKPPYNGLERLAYLLETTVAKTIVYLNRRPAVVRTPSGGYHIYAAFKEDVRVKADLKDGVEVKYGRRLLTAAGSAKLCDGTLKWYTMMNGDLRDAYTMTFQMDSRLGREMKYKELPKRTFAKYSKSMQELLKYCNGLSHNAAQVKFAKMCKENGIIVDECVAFCESNPSVFGYNDIDYTVQYCYRNY